MSFYNKKYEPVPGAPKPPSKVITELNNQDPSMIKKIDAYRDESAVKVIINTMGPEGKKALTDLNKRHDVCGKDYYVRNTVWRENNPKEDPCHVCPPLAIIDIQKTNTAAGGTIADAVSKEFTKNGFPNVPPMEELTKMCTNAHIQPPPGGTSDSIYTWFPAQHAEKPYGVADGDFAGKDAWTRISTVINNDAGNVSSADKGTLKQWYVDRLSDEYLMKRMDKLNWWGKDNKQDITQEQRLHNFKEAISKDRGKTVDCKEKAKVPPWLIKDPTTLIGDEKSQYDKFKCATNSTGKSKFGPDNIIRQEYEEWSSNYMGNPTNLYATGKGDFKLWGQPLMPINRDFEGCINNLLNENTNDYDKNLIQGISNKKSIYALDDGEVLFIKRKLQMLFANDVTDDIIKCISKNMILDRSICDAGLTEQMNFVLNVLFSIIGFKFNLHEINMNNSSNKERLVYIIKHLGDIIPKALKRIVEISKKLEVKECGGKVSNNTLILDELYSKIFTSGKNVVNFDLGISDMISKATNQEFDRTTVIVVLAIAFLKYF